MNRKRIIAGLIIFSTAILVDMFANRGSSDFVWSTYSIFSVALILVAIGSVPYLLITGLWRKPTGEPETIIQAVIQVVKIVVLVFFAILFVTYLLLSNMSLPW